VSDTLEHELKIDIVVASPTLALSLASAKGAAA